MSDGDWAYAHLTWIGHQMLLKRSDVQEKNACMYHRELDYDFFRIARRWSNEIVREHARTLSAKGNILQGI
jgi:hypothetical protein